MAAQKGSTVGGACTVTSGPNKGKTGTYTRDEEGNLWCEGPWGGTQCAEKCTDANVSLTVFESVDAATDQVVFEIEGLIEVEGRGIFLCSAKIDPTSGAGRDVVAVRSPVIPLSSLRESPDKLDRMVADVVGSHINK
jgi:hypothetical protein